MALWVSPPPQGFSQARCSSKISTWWPARASCSPHIAPEGPPPMIAILDMVSRGQLRISLAGNEISRESPHRPADYLGDGEDHQAKTREQYSTEEGRREGGGGFFSDTFHAQKRKDEKHSQVQSQKNKEDSAAVQKGNADNQGDARDQTPGQA